MKTYRSYLFIAGLALGLTACNKQLETSPSNAVSEEIVLKNLTNLTALSEGTWASMMDDFYGGVFGNPGFKVIALVSEVMGNDVALITTKYSYAPNYRFTQMVDKTQSRNSAIWNQLYKIINIFILTSPIFKVIHKSFSIAMLTSFFSCTGFITFSTYFHILVFFFLNLLYKLFFNLHLL